MKLISFLYIACACLVFNACTNVDASVDTNLAAKTTAAAAKTIAKKDTTAPKSAVTRTINKRPNSPYNISKSRPKSEIKQMYPYDLALTDGVGKKTSTEEIFKTGKPTVVLFWLTTCYPCRLEMAAIKKKYDQWQDETDFNLVAISTDFDKNYEKYLKYVEDADWPWEAYHDTNREFRNVMPGQLNGLPQTFIFDKDGNIAMHKKRFRPGDEDKLYDQVKLLASK